MAKLIFSSSIFLLFLTACATNRSTSSAVEAEVSAVVQRQVLAWNVGDLAGFMETYARSDRTRFAGGAEVSFGWQTVYDRYRRKYGEAASSMGQLSFSDIDITVLAPDAALAFGHWHLKRGQDETGGVFTLLFRKTNAGWRIVHDHSS